MDTLDTIITEHPLPSRRLLPARPSAGPAFSRLTSGISLPALSRQRRLWHSAHVASEKSGGESRFGYEPAMRARKLMLERLKATQLQLVEFYQPGG